MHSKLQAAEYRRDAFLAFLAFVIAVFLWQVHGLYFLTYPFRLFVTMIHELGHGLAAILTGGSFVRYEVIEGGAGLAYTSGGSRFFIIQAGYLGTALFGAALLFFSNRARHPGRIAIGLGLFIGILALLYSGLRVANLSPVEIVVTAIMLVAATYLILMSDTNQGRYAGLGIIVIGALLLIWFAGVGSTLLTVIVGLTSALVLIVIGYYADRDVVMVTLNFLAFLLGLQAINDAWVLFKIVSAPRSMMPLNDAASMAQAYGGSAAVWALGWIMLDGLLFGTAVYFTFVRLARRD